MTDLRERFAQLDEIETEDLWWEIELRFEQEVERVPYQVARPRRRLAVAGASAVLVAILIGIAFLIRSGQETPPVITQPLNTTSLPAPTSTVPVQSSTTGAPVVSGPRSAFDWVEVSDASLAGEKLANGIALQNGAYVMVGADQGDAAVWQSVNGLAWSQLSSPGFGGPGDQAFKDVVGYGDGLVAVGETIIYTADDDYHTEPLIVISRDGSTWEIIDTQDKATFPGDGPWISSVAVRGDRLIAAGSDVWVSDDGENWILSLDLPDTHRAYDVAASELGIAVVGQSFRNISNAFIRWSADGDEWAPIPGLTPDGMNTFLYSVAATSDGFIAGGGISDDDGTSSDGGLAAAEAAIWVSRDGIGWDLAPQEEQPDRGTSVNGFVETREVLVAFGIRMASSWNTATGVLWESTDGGLTWQGTGNPESVFGTSGWTTLDAAALHDGGLIVVGKRLDDAGVWLGAP